MIGGAKGIGLGLDFGIGNQLRPRNSKPYIEQAVLDSLCGVWIADQNTNESPTRNIIKNKISNRGGDFEILNAAYKGNSGYGLYQFDWSNWSSDTESAYNVKITKKHNKVTYENNIIGNALNLYKSGTFDTTKIKFKVSDKDCTVQVLYKNIGSSSDTPYITAYQKAGITEHIVEIPPNRIIDFVFSSITKQSFTVEQIPDHKGAFVTDGVDDLIASQKTTPEMLSNGNEITVVTMSVNLQQVGGKRINFLSSISSYLENILATTAIDKHSISGYTSTNYDTAENHLNIPFILGDIEDYTLNKANDSSTRGFNRFGVNGYVTSNTYRSANIAWYWTFIANKVLTSDQINQIIEYFNLDKYVVPDVLYNVKRQGITNDNHASFGDKLIDYSGKGHDMQLYNIGWEGTSGVNSYPVIFGSNKTYRDLSDVNVGSIKYTVSNTKFNITEVGGTHAINYNFVKYGGSIEGNKINNVEVPEYRIKVTGLFDGIYIRFKYIKTEYATEVSALDISKDGIYTIPKSFKATSNLTGWTEFVGFQIFKKQDLGDCNITIEVLPEHDGALVLDGVNDYGQYVGDLGLKDYTVVADRSYLKETINEVPITSRVNSGSALDTPFVFEHITTTNIVPSPYSFGKGNIITNDYRNNRRAIIYQSTYKYMEEPLVKGTSTNTGDGLTIGRNGSNEQYSALCLYSLMLFPYSLSKFLIERQLKKHKLGTMYEDMIQFRPIVTSNVPYSKIEYFDENWNLISVGDYIPINSAININITLIGGGDEVSNVNPNQGVVLKVEQSGTTKPNIWDIRIGSITKSILKLDIAIDEYIRFEDIVQPYPFFMEFVKTTNEPGWENKLTWGSKLRVGKKYLVAVWNDLFGANSGYPLYVPTDKFKIFYNEVRLMNGLSSFIIAEKSMVFRQEGVEWMHDSNEPKCILSPELMKMPNESYEYLGYIPDISGHGNHGFFNNVGFTDVSGADENGIIHLDGVDDFISFRSMLSGKQMFMKFSWTNTAASIAYDQRSAIDLSNSFALLAGKDVNVSYSQRNADKTYINGIENKYITNDELIYLVHNVLLVNENTTTGEIPIIGKNKIYDGYNTKMSLYTFMLFDEISTPEKIRELNEIIGINPMIDVPPYYYDAHGKTNQDTDKTQLVNLGNGGEHTLNINNVAYEGESGYKDNALLLDGVDDSLVNTTIPALTDFTCIVKREMIGEQINGSSFMNKGQNPTTGGTKNAFMYDYKTASGKYIYSFSNANKVDTANLISYITPISADGQNITKGTGGDDVGLMIGKWDTWWKGVFYKLMLYPKTLDMLQINMLKNLFELDEKIDINNPIFKK